MQQAPKIQPEEMAKTRERIKANGISQDRLARELSRSQGAIARALRGERNTLLGRIIRWLDRYERARGQRAA